MLFYDHRHANFSSSPGRFKRELETSLLEMHDCLVAHAKPRS